MTVSPLARALAPAGFGRDRVKVTIAPAASVTAASDVVTDTMCTAASFSGMVTAALPGLPIWMAPAAVRPLPLRRLTRRVSADSARMSGVTPMTMLPVMPAAMVRVPPPSSV